MSGKPRPWHNNGMTIALLLLILASPAAAEPLSFVSFSELRAQGAAADIAAAKRMMIILTQFLGPEEQQGYPVKDGFTLIAAPDATTRELARRAPAFAALAKDGRQIIDASEALQRFEDARELFCALLASIAKADPSDKTLKMMADWGKETWVQTDPAIELHSAPVLSRSDYDALKLKP